MKFTCIHGGRKHRKRSPGQRKSSTIKKGCPCFISFRLDKEGDNLVVSRLDTEHANHEINKCLYGFYPKVRKLSAADKSYAEQLLAIKADKKMLQQQLKKDTGKRVSLRDLNNIHAAAKRQNSTRNDVINGCLGCLVLNFL